MLIFLKDLFRKNSQTAIAIFKKRLDNEKILNSKLFEECWKEYLTQEQINCKFAQKLFDNLMKSVKKFNEISDVFKI